MSNSPNDKKDLSDASLLSAAITAAPSVAGIGYGLHQMMKQTQFRPPRETPFASAHRRVSGQGFGNMSKLGSLDFLQSRQASFLTPQGAEIARRAWQEAVSTSHPRAAQMLSFTGNITQMPFGDVYSAIEQTVRRNESQYMYRTLQKFRSNVTALERQSKLTGGKLPDFVSATEVSKPPRMNMPIKLESLPTDIMETTTRIQRALGAFGDFSFTGRKGREGFGTFNLGFTYQGGRFNVRVPVAQGGRLMEGSTLATQRLAPDVLLFDAGNKVQMSRHAFFLRNVEETILPGIQSGVLKTGWDVQRAVDELYRENIYSLESVPNPPSGVFDAGLERQIALRSKQIDIRFKDPALTSGPSGVGKSPFRPPTSREFTEVMSTNPQLIPSTSPKPLAEGRVSTLDPRGWFPTPTAVDLSRRPTQVIREWKATPEAVRAMLDSGSVRRSIFETQQWRREMGPYAAPHLRAVYVDPTRHQDLLSKLRVGDGESLISDEKYIKQMMEVERMAPAARLRPGTVRKELQEYLAGGKKLTDLQFKPGEVLGWTTEGTPFTYEKGMSLVALEANSTKGTGDFLSLFYKEKPRLGNSPKFFGDDKGLARFTDWLDVHKEIRPLTKNPLFNEGTKELISMEVLRKENARHNRQMISSLWDMLDRFRSPKIIASNPKLASFMRNPNTFGEFLEKKAQIMTPTGPRYHHAAMVKQLTTFAIKEANLDPQEFGAVFGAVPFVLGDEARQIIDNDVYYKAASEGFTIGDVQRLFGGTAELTGSGAMGSIEPRVFELLNAGQYGQLGKDIADDLALRVAASNPEKLAAHRALSSTLASIDGKLSPGIGEKPFQIGPNFSSEAFQEWMEKGGGWLRTGKYGISDISIPSMKELEAAASFVTASGEVVKSNIASDFHAYARTAARAFSDSNRAGAEEVRSALDTLVGSLGEQQPAAGKGVGAYLRGKVEGSRFFKGVSKVGSFVPPHQGVAGISEGGAKKMFEELFASGIYNKDAVAEMQRQLFSDQIIGGGIARHPFFDPYSFQGIGLKLMRGVEEDVVALPWEMVDIRLAGEEKANPILISPMVGMGGDLDADNYSISLLEPSLAKRVKTEAFSTDSAYRQAYVQHSIRSQIIKAKAAKMTEGAMTISNMQRMIAEGKKLATAQQWVPLLSTNLSRARSAIGSSLEGQRAANAHFLLKWLEQVPIAGKHLNPEDVLNEQMSGFFQTVSSSIDTMNKDRLLESIQGIFAHAGETTKQLLVGDVKITGGREALAKASGLATISDTLNGVNAQNAVDDIMSALEVASVTGAEEAAKFATGRKKLGLDSLSRFLNMSGNFVTQSGGSFAKVSEAATMASNYLAAAGRGLMKHKKAIGFGFAGSLALSTLLSTPKETVGSGSNALVPADMNKGKAADRMSPETIVPQGQSLGSPSVPPMLHQRRAVVAPGGESVRISVRGTSRNRVNGTDLARQTNRFSNGNTNVNVRDNSSSMSIHSFLNKLV